MRHIDAIWFTGLHGIIGIVVGEDEHTGDRKAYVGLGLGTSIESDIQRIAEFGAPLSPEIAAKISYLLHPEHETKT